MKTIIPGIVILFMFAFILTTASLMIEHAWNSNRSNIRLLERLIDDRGSASASPLMMKKIACVPPITPQYSMKDFFHPYYFSRAFKPAKNISKQSTIIPYSISALEEHALMPFVNVLPNGCS